MSRPFSHPLHSAKVHTEFLSSLTRINTYNPPVHTCSTGWSFNGLLSGPTSLAYLFHRLSEWFPEDKFEFKGQGLLDWAREYLDLGSVNACLGIVNRGQGLQVGNAGGTGVGVGVGVGSEWLVWKVVRACLEDDESLIGEVLAVGQGQDQMQKGAGDFIGLNGRSRHVKSDVDVQSLLDRLGWKIGKAGYLYLLRVLQRHFSQAKNTTARIQKMIDKVVDEMLQELDDILVFMDVNGNITDVDSGGHSNDAHGTFLPSEVALQLTEILTQIVLSNPNLSETNDPPSCLSSSIVTSTDRSNHTTSSDNDSNTRTITILTKLLQKILDLLYLCHDSDDNEIQGNVDEENGHVHWWGPISTSRIIHSLYSIKHLLPLSPCLSYQLDRVIERARRRVWEESVHRSSAVIANPTLEYGRMVDVAFAFMGGEVDEEVGNNERFDACLEALQTSELDQRVDGWKEKAGKWDGWVGVHTGEGGRAWVWGLLGSSLDIGGMNGAGQGGSRKEQMTKRMGIIGYTDL